MTLVETRQTIQVERWPTEIPLYIFAVLASIVMWVFTALTILGALYAVLLGLIFYLAHVTFVGHVRGSAVRVGPDQFPDLHDAVERISGHLGLATVPEAYVMQAGGALNALATRFLRSNMIVLYSDLLEACGPDTSARDLIVGHELGHLRAGHLRWPWLILPAMLVPALGTALSRAREYTADRYGAAVAGGAAGACRGLLILAAGPTYGRRAQTEPFLRQRESMNTGWMTLAEWFATHPPLSKRLAAVTPGAPPLPSPWRGPGRAIGIILLACTPALVGTVYVLFALPGWMQRLADAQKEAARQTTSQRAVPRPTFKAPPLEEGRATAARDFASLSALLEERRRSGLGLPWDGDELSAVWAAAHPGQPEPVDPFDGTGYGYHVHDRDYLLYSVGPDQDGYSDDDLIYDSRIRGIRERHDLSRVLARP
jgi:Zn-dependent protease with chaperone function